MVARAQLESVRSELAAAARGGRSAVVNRWATTLGVSPAKLYRLLSAGGEHTTRTRGPTRPEIREWAKLLLELMARSPGGTIPLHLCLEAALMGDPTTGEMLLPPEAGAVSLGTYQRIIRDELGGRDTHRRNRRMHADRPNQAWQIDASHSKFLIVDRELEDGDFLLRLHRAPTPASGYKNKPLPEHRLRLLYYAIWDMRTGYQWIQPRVARGESSLDAMQALCDAMVRRPDPRDPLHGVPEDLWSDQGVLTKSAATTHLLEQGLHINVVTGEAYRKERMGGVEQIWRRLWQSFEQTLFIAASGAGRWTIPLSALQLRLTEYLARVNAAPSRRDKEVSRRDLWVREINQVGGAKLCPERPMETLAQEVRRWVDGSGVIRWNNVEYEVPSLHRCWVIARRALDGSNRVIVEDERTGKRFDCTPWQPLPYGEHLRSPTIPIEKARAQASISTYTLADPFAPSERPAAAANVVTGRFGPRARPADPLPDPLDADHYASLSQAMADFHHWIGAPLSVENRALIEQQLLAQGLRKDFVRELAATLTTALGATR
jgi:hypothetical protein